MYDKKSFYTLAFRLGIGAMGANIDGIKRDGTVAVILPIKSVLEFNKNLWTQTIYWHFRGQAFKSTDS